MAEQDTHLKMTGDDLRAARVLTLAVKFFGTNRPVSSSTIAAELYPDVDVLSFKRQFLRDRELLATFGLVIREIEGNGTDSAWKVDEAASYVQGGELSARDARMLYVLCHDMAFDQAFPYRDELRIALAKIARMYRGTIVPRTDATTTTEHKLLAVLVSCMSNRHAATVTYTNAHGVTDEKTIALLGSFGLRGQTYFVASMVEADGTLIPNSTRTYRLDRFVKARELPRISYQVPADFSVGDYERLPFQMGEQIGQAQFVVGKDASSEVERAMANYGHVDGYDDKLIWSVDYASEEALASWAIGAGLVPSGPASLCATWHDLLTKTVDGALYDGALGRQALLPEMPKPHKRAGRTGSITTARQLMALATSLTAEGEVITAQDIATTLGISYDEARHLIALVSLGSGESIDYLPVVLSDDDDEVSLMEGAALSGRRVRLTRAETIALSAALAQLGVAQDDPLAKALSDAYAAPSFSAEDVAQSLEAPSSSAEGYTLRTCSRAIAEGDGLAFTYRPVTGGDASTRRVIPQRLRHGDDNWYLDAFDLMRLDQRVFRIDRMSDLRCIEAQMPTMPPASDHREQCQVIMRIDDPLYLDLFHWEGMRVIAREGNAVTFTLPLYGGSWLARHLAACAGTARVSDQQLAAQAQTYAHELLNS